MTDKSKRIAKLLLNTGAVRLNVENYFTFASGIKSPIYCDNRFLLGFPKERDEIIEQFCDIDFVQKAEVIAGTSTAGIAWAAIIADRLKKPMAYVRSESKSHGTGKLIEGADVLGKKTVIIEDLISTGGSSKKVLDNLIIAEAEIIGIAAIFSYEFPESTTIFGNTECKTLSTFSTLIELAKSDHILTESECEIASSWNNSPTTWGI